MAISGVNTKKTCVEFVIVVTVCAIRASFALKSSQVRPHFLFLSRTLRAHLSSFAIEGTLLYLAVTSLAFVPVTDFTHSVFKTFL